MTETKVETLCELMDQLWHDLSQCDLDIEGGTDNSVADFHAISLTIGELMGKYWPMGAFMTATGHVLVHDAALEPYSWTSVNVEMACINRVRASRCRLPLAGDSVPVQ